jgi:predicted helicase
VVGRYRALNTLITDEDVFFHVYGLLHSPQYRSAFAADLKKSLPRIPPVETAEMFWAFSRAGRALADQHLTYEDVEPRPDLRVSFADGFDADAPAAWRVEKMRYPKVTDSKSRKKIDDRTTVIVNSRITVAGIPERAHECVFRPKAASDSDARRPLIPTQGGH